MTESKHLYPILINELHLDTFGHVNNATYLQIFEEARWDLITKNGYGLAEVHRLKQGPTILELSLKFKREIRNREHITVETFCRSYERKIGKLTQNMINQKGEISCEMDMTFGLFDMTERKLIEPTPAWKRAIGFSSK